MKFLFSIGVVDKNFVYMIVGGFFRFFVNLFLGPNILSPILSHSLVMNIASSLGLMISIIPMIIYKIRNNEMKCCCEFVENVVKYDLVYNDSYRKVTYGKYKWILLSSIIDFIQTVVFDEFTGNCKANMWIFDILFMSFFSFFFFKIKLYIHHYISIILIICVGISLDIYLSHYIFNDIDVVISMLFKFISEIILSFGFVIDKYTMEKKFCSPYEMCFFHGAVNFILSLILLSFSREIGLDNYDEFFQNFSSEKFWAFFLMMITQLIFNIFILIINKNKTPCHIIIMLIIGQFAPYIKALTNDTKNSIILIIGLLIIFLFSLIFNEIIEVNCLKLQLNTKKNIALRARYDSLSVINFVNELNEEEEEEADDNDDENNKINDSSKSF